MAIWCAHEHHPPPAQMGLDSLSDILRYAPGDRPPPRRSAVQAIEETEMMTLDQLREAAERRATIAARIVGTVETWLNTDVVRGETAARMTALVAAYNATFADPPRVSADNKEGL